MYVYISIEKRECENNSVMSQRLKRTTTNKKKLSILKKKILLERLKRQIECNVKRGDSETISSTSDVKLFIFEFVGASDLEDREETEEILSDLYELLTPCGTPTQAEIIAVSLDAANDPKYCVQVSFQDSREVYAAAMALNGLLFGGERIRVLVGEAVNPSWIFRDKTLVNKTPQLSLQKSIQCIENSQDVKGDRSSAYVLCLSNLVQEDDLEDTDELEEICSDLRELCRPFCGNEGGEILGVSIRRTLPSFVLSDPIHSQPGSNPPEEPWIVIQFSDFQSALSVLTQFDGKVIAGNAMRVHLYDRNACDYCHFCEDYLVDLQNIDFIGILFLDFFPECDAADEKALEERSFAVESLRSEIEAVICEAVEPCLAVFDERTSRDVMLMQSGDIHKAFLVFQQLQKIMASLDICLVSVRGNPQSQPPSECSKLDTEKNKQDFVILCRHNWTIRTLSRSRKASLMSFDTVYQSFDAYNTASFSQRETLPLREILPSVVVLKNFVTSMDLLDMSENFDDIVQLKRDVIAMIHPHLNHQGTSSSICRVQVYSEAMDFTSSEMDCVSSLQACVVFSSLASAHEAVCFLDQSRIGGNLIRAVIGETLDTLTSAASAATDKAITPEATMIKESAFDLSTFATVCQYCKTFSSEQQSTSLQQTAVVSKYTAARSAPKQPTNGSDRSHHYPIHTADEETNGVIKELLKMISTYQLRMKGENPSKAKMRLRYVCGIKQTTYGIKANKVKLVLLAPNIESSDAIDEKISLMISLAREREIPVLYCLSKRILGKSLQLSMKQSVIAVYDPNGAYDRFKKILRFVEYKEKEASKHSGT